ncbi:hypothetical protein KL918_004953 [Ogataea parapolymorpha]|uniref:Pre-mRNA-splicing factor CWC2 n=1 Tax=Ogataea parapolymorpha (strain ATCC 26012 / BCRC 20466 / JCM 22074 / NRRL Y-7560 / DL-1) TaxID=871575 RepID=W1QI95_OGAPD|nr:Pre-mRNA-splicing factor CWC2 [Ogataea parapolymorpha DL-1]ESX00164.1 Pre-mRNA-splicing factor CWC2 [Ogataea parapolymorpha DL-1]KAG7865077.1 hypothetical protein KL918_004953 [Ogataea parapolymorpha]KAG7872237.1 hypothetical protein KL916_003260 [Ogataea parapolymorpha]
MARRPARLQLDPESVTADTKPPQTGQVFNLWYSRWTGGEYNGRTVAHARHRCHPAKDAGYTKADKHVEPGSVNRDKFICLYFARGYCTNGKNCDYLHRLPTDMDFFPHTVDCFGRERFADYRDDMTGVGSFNKVNKTLFVEKFRSMEGNVEMLVNKNFGEYGEVERTRVVRSKGIAFVTYRLESQAQFAKEAMYGQSLREDDDEEALNVKWANEDPDPVAKKRNREEEEQTALETAKKLLATMQEKLRRVEEKEPEQKTADGEETQEDVEKAPKALPAPQPSSIFANKSLDAIKLLQKKPTLATKLGYDSDSD